MILFHRRASRLFGPGPTRAQLDPLIVLGWAAALRILFAVLTSGTYDPDEFVLLTLSRAYSHGAVPYRDFAFFHPPGILVTLRVLQPIVAVWWPAARVLTILADVGTALLTWRIGLRIYGRRGGLAAGLLYGASPLVLIAGVRIGQDPLITTLGLGGLALVLLSQSRRGAVGAGISLALAIWIKYPALLFLPVYLLAAPRRAFVVTGSMLVASILLFTPFALEFHALVHQTILWQKSRPATPLATRVEHLIVFWLLLNLLAVPGLFRDRPPPWLAAGFGLGGLFILAPQVYEHYLVPVVPFAALLAAPLVARSTTRADPGLIGLGVCLVVFTGGAAASGASPVRNFVSTARFSSIRPVVRFLDHTTPPGSQILSDRFEYAYLARRRAALHYFWNLSSLIGVSYLQGHLHFIRAVVVTLGPPGFPGGFVDKLPGDGLRVRRVGAADVWSWTAAATEWNTGSNGAARRALRS